MSYTFSHVNKDTVVEYTVVNNDITWMDLLDHFEKFLKASGYHFEDGFVGFEARYQQEDEVGGSVSVKPVAKSAAQQFEFDWYDSTTN